jgi:hypothetical protein
MSVAPVSPTRAELESPAPAAGGGTWVVQPGDTLGAIARTLRRGGTPASTAELVRTLCRLNPEIRDPDRIEVGRLLQLPGAEPSAAGVEAQDSIDGGTSLPAQSPPPSLFRAEERGQLLKSALFRLMQARSIIDRIAGGPPSQGSGPTAAYSAQPPSAEHPRSTDGTPLFRQGDPAWNAERLGRAAEGPTLSQAGCAVTACAMALSRMGGTVLTPDALVRHLRAEGGFQGPLLDWSRTVSAVPGVSRAAPGPFEEAALDRELDAGRPVLLRVAHDVHGRDQQHWVCLTGRDPRSGLYSANDPATGRSTALVLKDGALVSASGEPIRYASDGRMVTFQCSKAISSA